MTTTTPWVLHTNADRLKRPPMEWFIENVLPPTGLGQIFGDTGAGKSFVAIDLALRICNGEDGWYGNKINVQGPVVYAFMEGVHDQQARIDAWVTAHPGRTADNLYTLDEEALNLGDPKAIGKLLLAIQEANIQPRLLVVDTQALATSGIEENDNGAMGDVLARLKRWSFKYGYPIITVHHTGKDLSKGARGASAWKAGLDLQIEVTPENLKVTKVKGAPSTKWIGFKLTLSGRSAWAKPAVGTDGLRTLGVNQHIIDYLNAHPAQKTLKQILEHFGNGVKYRHALDELMKSDEILPQMIDRVENGKTYERKVWIADGSETLDFSEWDALSDEEQAKLESGEDESWRYE